MQWADLDLEARVWTIPRENTQGRPVPHEVPLAPMMVELLAALPRTGAFVFASRTGDRAAVRVQQAQG